MRTGHNGHVAISWTQTEIDGLEAAPLAFLAIGAAWSWRGQARLLSDAGKVGLGQTGEGRNFVTRTSQMEVYGQEVNGFAYGTVELTNGAQTFVATLFSVPDTPGPTLVFENGCPPRDQDFWISEVAESVPQNDAATEADDKVVSFPLRGRLTESGLVSPPLVLAKSQVAAD